MAQSKIVNSKSKIDTVILGDTMGDLRKFYSLATIIFVGRSLVPMGGSDMMEAAALGKCTIFGPHAFNFKQAVDALLADNGAIMVEDKDDLLAVMKKCLTDPDYAKTTAQNGRKVIMKNQGATQKNHRRNHEDFAIRVPKWIIEVSRTQRFRHGPDMLRGGSAAAAYYGYSCGEYSLGRGGEFFGRDPVNRFAID